MNLFETLTVIGTYLKGIEILEEKSFRNLTVYFLRSKEMSSLIKKVETINGTLVISEVHGKSVPNTMFDYKFALQSGGCNIIEKIPELKLKSIAYDATRRKITIGKYLKSFPCPNSEANGVLAAINGEADTLFTLGSNKLFRTHYTAMLTHIILYAIDKVRAKKDGQSVNPHNFLNDISQAVFESSPADGFGTFYRFQSSLVAGSALGFDNSIVHLEAFSRNKFEEA